jgi:hypothetical protein
MKCVGKWHKTLIAKISNDNGYLGSQGQLLNLCDFNTILGLPCVLPMLEFVNALMMFSCVITF